MTLLPYRPSISTTHKSMPESLSFMVEPMAVTDIDQVMEIEQVAFPSPWSARAYHYEITQNAHSTMLVVRSSAHSTGGLKRLVGNLLPRHVRVGSRGLVLGYAGFWLLVDEAHVCTIAVHPHWRGRGLGELLLISLLEQGIEQGASRATLEVRISNQVAQELYHKYAF
jgi:ribosomal-protein-alanine N-acetyltransferase